MANLLEWVRSELDFAFPNETDPMQLAIMWDAVDLIKCFCRQGHSGLSAAYVLGMFQRLVHMKPLSPLTGNEDEWCEPIGDEDDTQQNKRCPAVFRKHFDNDTAYNIEGIAFVDEEGITYTCRESKVPVKFPYTVPDEPEYVRRDRLK